MENILSEQFVREQADAFCERFAVFEGERGKRINPYVFVPLEGFLSKSYLIELFIFVNNLLLKDCIFAGMCSVIVGMSR